MAGHCYRNPNFVHDLRLTEKMFLAIYNALFRNLAYMTDVRVCNRERLALYIAWSGLLGGLGQRRLTDLSGRSNDRPDKPTKGGFCRLLPDDDRELFNWHSQTPSGA